MIKEDSRSTHCAFLLMRRSNRIGTNTGMPEADMRKHSSKNVQCVLRLSCSINKRLKMKQTHVHNFSCCTTMIFIDPKKAFDTVDHQILLNKMRNYGIDGPEHQWFSSYLDNRRQFCKVNGVCSDSADFSTEVPQGPCLGPLLFLIYINDLPFALKATMYADDTTISFSSDNIEEIRAVVNTELACLQKWLQGNKLSLNVVKFLAMIIGSLQKLRKIDAPWYRFLIFK